MRNKRHSKHENTGSSISGKTRKKAFWLLILLGVIVMLIYAVTFQEAEDSELIHETDSQSQLP